MVGRTDLASSDPCLGDGFGLGNTATDFYCDGSLNEAETRGASNKPERVTFAVSNKLLSSCFQSMLAYNRS